MPLPHNFYLPSKLGCAYTEGFADYAAIVTSTNQNPYFPGESGPYLNHGEDGSVIEGAVASFLYDLTDPANESWDNVDDYPGSYVADIIKDCQVKVNGNWNKHPDGIDEIIACFQNSIPDYSGFFPERSENGKTPPTAYQENVSEPAGWSTTAIKKLWYKDLYNETYTPPLEVSIEGPHFINSDGTYTWETHVANGTGNYSYQWKWRNQGDFHWTNVGTNQSYSRYIMQPTHAQSSHLKVIVASGSSQGSDVFTVTINGSDCPPGSICEGSRQNK